MKHGDNIIELYRESNPELAVCAHPDCARLVNYATLLSAISKGRALCCSRKCAGYFKKVPPEIAFWSHVTKGDGCWLWEGATNGCGYGCMKRRDGKKSIWYLAHRVSYEVNNGRIPPGMLVCHKCDNPKCVRPDHLYHLFLGTNADNMQDMLNKGRQAKGATSGAKTKPEKMPKGEQKWNAKLTESSVREIRKTIAFAKQSRQVLSPLIKELGGRYGVSSATIFGVVSGKQWKHVA